jgi:hypothetical protein
MGLGFGAGGETVAAGRWRDRGRDGDSLRYYVAIIVPQMPLSKIDCIVYLISARRAKERHLIFGACWRHCSERCEIFAEYQIFAQADLLICLGPTNTTKWNPEKWIKETQNWPLWNGGETGILKDPKPIGKKSYEALWTSRFGGNPYSIAHKSASERR